jgi:DNA-binding GntR family transcriptional regulator
MSRLSSVARASVGEQAANTLREAILRAELGPGEPLREVALADDLHVSRNTVREALRILEAERLVEYHLHRGVLVAPVRVEDVDDLYGVRAALEPSAILAVQSHTPQRVGAVAAAAESLARTALGGDPYTIAEADLGFHQSLVALRGSARLDAFFAGVCAEVRRFVVLISVADDEYRHPEPIVAQHRAIADALLGGAHDRAATLAREHIEANWARAAQIVGDGIVARLSAVAEHP